MKGRCLFCQHVSLTKRYIINVRWSDLRSLWFNFHSSEKPVSVSDFVATYFKCFRSSVPGITVSTDSVAVFIIKWLTASSFLNVKLTRGVSRHQLLMNATKTDCVQKWCLCRVFMLHTHFRLLTSLEVFEDDFLWCSVSPLRNTRHKILLLDVVIYHL